MQQAKAVKDIHYLEQQDIESLELQVKAAKDAAHAAIWRHKSLKALTGRIKNNKIAILLGLLL